MELLFTVYFTVVCPNENFEAFKPNLTVSDALDEIEYLKNNPTDGNGNCVLEDPVIGKNITVGES